MNKKIYIISIILIVIIISIVRILNFNKNKLNQNDIEIISEEEGNKLIEENIEKELEKNGLILENKVKKISVFNPYLEGNSYKVLLKDNNRSEYEIEVYVMTSEQREYMKEEDGEITIEDGEEKKAILFGNVLITETQNEDVNNIIKLLSKKIND